MSSILHWKPVAEYKGSLSDDLKFKLRELYGEPVDVELSHEHFNTLKALAACRVEDAERVMDLIERHGIIALKEKY